MEVGGQALIVPVYTTPYSIRMDVQPGQQGGVVPAKYPGVTAASRKQLKQAPIEDNNLNTLLGAVYEFKKQFWAEFLEVKKSQSPLILNEYTTILSQIYRCLVNKAPCPQFPYKNANSAEQSLKTLLFELQLDIHQRNYWLRRLLVESPLALRAM